jgi:hypothetical protein
MLLVWRAYRAARLILGVLKITVKISTTDFVHSLGGLPEVRFIDNGVALT